MVEPDAAKAKVVSPILKFLAHRSIPHVVFINKMDNPISSLEETIGALQEVSELPLVLRHVPIRDGDKTTGYLDLISQRAYQYKEGEPSTVVEVPAELADAQRKYKNTNKESIKEIAELARRDDRVRERLEHEEEKRIEELKVKEADGKVLSVGGTPWAGNRRSARRP